MYMHWNRGKRARSSHSFAGLFQEQNTLSDPAACSHWREWAASIPTSCFLSVFETHAGVWDQSCLFERWKASIWVHSVIISVITLLINESLSSDIGRSGWEGCTSMCWVVGVPDSCTELCWLGVLGLSCHRSPMRCTGQGRQLLGECCRHPAMEVEVKSQWPNADWH